MRKLGLVIFIIIGIIGFSALVYADVPRVINYQGKFTDKDDNPLSGNYLVTFRFYEVVTEGNPIWEESHILTIKDGIFNVLLGSIKSLDIDFNKDLWLGIEVASDGEMSPRIKLTSSPYALNAQAIDMIDSSQLMRNDIDSVMAGSLTLKKDLILRGDISGPSRLVLTDRKGSEYFLWVDDTGNLRIKQGLPTSDKDGATIIEKASKKRSSPSIQNITLFLVLVVILIFGLMLYSTKKR